MCVLTKPITGDANNKKLTKLDQKRQNTNKGEFTTNPLEFVGRGGGVMDIKTAECLLVVQR